MSAQISRIHLSRKKNSAKRQAPKKRNIISLVKNLFLASVLIIAVVVGVNLFQSWKSKMWISGTRFTIVVAEHNPVIYSYNPTNEELTVIEIPQNVQLEATRGYGTWLAGSLWELGKQENLKGDLLAASLSKSFGIPIDGWIGPNGSLLFKSQPLGLVSALHKSIFPGGMETNLTIFDRISLLMKVSNLSIANRQEINIVDRGVLKRTVFADGLEGYLISPDQAKVMFTFLKDDLISKEGLNAVVINAAGKNGLASEVVNISSLLGLRVIGTETRQSLSEEDCLIKASSSLRETFSVRKLSKILGCEVSGQNLESHADIEIVLGEKFSKRF